LVNPASLSRTVTAMALPEGVALSWRSRGRV
jgi:hypothetical protein